MAVEASELLRIGEVARRFEVSPRTLRYYEEVGLLRPSASTEGGFRLYSEQDADRLRRIIRLKDVLGLTLDEVREVIEADDRLTALREQARGTTDPGRRLQVIDSITAILERQRELVRRKRAQLDAFVEELDEKLVRCRKRRSEIRAEVRLQGAKGRR